jgi:hypothetical protein
LFWSSHMRRDCQLLAGYSCTVPKQSSGAAKYRVVFVTQSPSRFQH